MTATEKALSAIDANLTGSLDRLFELIRIPSVSTDPAYSGDCRKAADWVVGQLRELGFEASARETGGQPMVVGHYGVNGSGAKAGDGVPHVLFYGHYDVQPPDPLELWASPPFEPVHAPAVEGGPGERIVARGAVDDKGQVMMFLEAMRAWKETSGQPGGGVRWTVLLEGEEESGSANLDRYIQQNKDRLGATDVCVISDTGMLGRGRPAITYGVRGLAYTEVVLHGPDQDLHSGLWGGKAPNPINELTRVLAQLWDDDRRVTLPGFYDRVRELTDGERAEWRGLGVDDAAALRGIGLPPEASVGERGFTPTEREWGRPTCDINGIWGGYTGAGAKTVIPSHASAKVSFRLVADQEPEAITASFFDWVRERTPPGCRWELIDHSGGPPATVATDSEALRAAAGAIERACGVAPAMIKSGGSIPVAGMLKEHLGLETIFMGFGLEDDRMHSPNEKFELECFRMGARSHACLVEALQGLGG